MSPSPITSYHNATTNKGYEAPVSLLHEYETHQESTTRFIGKKSAVIYQGDPQSCYSDNNTIKPSENNLSQECNEDQLSDDTNNQPNGFIAYLSRVREGETEVIKFTFNYFKQLKEMISNDNELRRSNSSKVQVYIVKPNQSDNCHKSFIEKVRDFAVFSDSLNIQVSIVENTPELTENQPALTVNQQKLSKNQPEVTGNQPGVTENQPQIKQDQPKGTQSQPEVTRNQTNILAGQPSLHEERPQQPVLIKEEPVEEEQSRAKDNDDAVMESPPTRDFFSNKAMITSLKRESARKIRPSRIYNNAFTSSTGDIAIQAKMKKVMQNLQEHTKDLQTDDSLTKKFLLVRNLIKALKLNLKFGKFSSEFERQHRVNQLARAERALVGITIRINQNM